LREVEISGNGHNMLVFGSSFYTSTKKIRVDIEISVPGYCHTLHPDKQRHPVRGVVVYNRGCMKVDSFRNPIIALHYNQYVVISLFLSHFQSFKPTNIFKTFADKLPLSSKKPYFPQFDFMQKSQFI